MSLVAALHIRPSGCCYGWLIIECEKIEHRVICSRSRRQRPLDQSGREVREQVSHKTSVRDEHGRYGRYGRYGRSFECYRRILDLKDVVRQCIKVCWWPVFSSTKSIWGELDCSCQNELEDFSQGRCTIMVCITYSSAQIVYQVICIFNSNT